MSTYESGNLIGISNLPNGTNASGVWDAVDQYNLRRSSLWPVVQGGLLINMDPSSPSCYSGFGSAITEISNYNVTGALFNSPIYSTSDGGIFYLNGSNNYITFPNTTVYNTSTYTISVWVNINSFPSSSSQFRIFNRQAGNNNTWALGIARGDYFGGSASSMIVWGLTGYGTGFTVLASTTNLLPGVWYNLVYTVTGTTSKIYINGSLDITGVIGGTAASTINATPTIGALSSEAGGGFNLGGRFGQCLFYNRALSDSEVAANYANTRGRFRTISYTTSGLIGNWDFSDPLTYTGDAVYNSSVLSPPTNQNLTLYNRVPTWVIYDKNNKCMTFNRSSTSAPLSGNTSDLFINGGFLYTNPSGSLASSSFCWANNWSWELVFRINDATANNFNPSETFNALAVYVGYHVGFVYDPTGLEFWNWNGNSFAPSIIPRLGVGSDVVVGSWYHIVLTKSGSSFLTYLNGTLVRTHSATTSTNSLVISNNRFSIGAATLVTNTNATYAYISSSSVGVNRMYSITLTQAQITANYNAVKSTYGLP